MSSIKTFIGLKNLILALTNCRSFSVSLFCLLSSQILERWTEEVGTSQSKFGWITFGYLVTQHSWSNCWNSSFSIFHRSFRLITYFLSYSHKSLCLVHCWNPYIEIVASKKNTYDTCLCIKFQIYSFLLQICFVFL